MKLIKLATALAFAGAATAAYATVTFDPATGTGFVGKGDVQLVFGWNNAQLQNNAGSLSFSYQTESKYDATCEWTTTAGNGRIIYHDVTVNKTVQISDSVAYDARTHKQVDGFNLTGFGSVSQNIDTPVVGGACLGAGGQQGTWTSVALTSSSGGLYVSGPSGSALLPSSAPI